MADGLTVTANGGNRLLEPGGFDQVQGGPGKALAKAPVAVTQFIGTALILAEPDNGVIKGGWEGFAVGGDQGRSPASSRSTSAASMPSMLVPDMRPM